MTTISCGLECVLFLACSRWAFRRCTHSGIHDSHSWPPAAPSDFTPIPSACRSILAAYDPDLLPSQNITSRTSHSDTLGRCPPYLLYTDPSTKQVTLAVRGLSLSHRSDYRLLFDNHGGAQPFGDGYVHRGLFRAAVWLLHREGDAIRRLLREVGSEGRLVLVGHSIGAGIAALVALLVVNHLDRFGGIERSRVRCYAVAPARCVSLNLAVKYADVIQSVVLQDDFLLRTPTPLEHIFGSIFCLPCLLVFVCMRDTFVSEDGKLKDPTRLYAPGRIYHIVNRKACRCGRFPPEVRTAVPVEGRFEHIVLSCNATSDHSIVWIEREAQKALEIMMDNADASTPPAQQKMERELSLKQEHKDAMEKAESLNLVMYSASTEGLSDDIESAPSESLADVTSCSVSGSSGSNWDELVKLLDEEGT